MGLATLLARGRLVRTIGFDDAPFVRGAPDPVVVVGAVCAGTRFEGLLTTSVTPDGFDATERLLAALRASKFLPQLHAVLLDGLTLGGFNVVDLPRLSDELGLPALAVVRRRPDLRAVADAVAQLDEAVARQALIERAGPVHRGEGVWFQCQGVDPPVASALLAAVTDRGHVPESLRLAHLIGGGIVLGESGRRA